MHSPYRAPLDYLKLYCRNLLWNRSNVENSNDVFSLEQLAGPAGPHVANRRRRSCRGVGTCLGGGCVWYTTTGCPPDAMTASVATSELPRSPVWVHAASGAASGAAPLTETDDAPDGVLCTVPSCPR